jgi:DNA-binding MarR family transcriptional regulator
VNKIKISDKLRLLDGYLHALTMRFYLRPSRNGVASELSTSETFVCSLLGRKGTHTMTELAAKCGLALSSMTAIVDRLVSKGYVMRSRDDVNDRRKVFVELSENGEKVYQDLLESEMEIIIDMMDSLEPKEQDMLLHVLGKVTASLD